MTPYTYAQEFARFKDHPESPFYQSTTLGLTPEETWAKGVEALDVLLHDVITTWTPDRPYRLSIEVLCDWHHRIFGSLFPDRAGRLRLVHDGDWDHVYFGAEIGSVRSRRVRQLRGTHPKRLKSHLHRLCTETNQRFLALSTGSAVPLEAVLYLNAELYCKLLRIHPWPDGNLRVAYVALQATLSSADLPAIEFKDLARHDDMLGKAFQGDNRPYSGIARLLLEEIRGSALG